MPVRRFPGRLCFAALSLLLLSPLGTSGQTEALRGGFLKPPDAARPWVYWEWMDGNLTREGITADLQAMKKAGLGGAVICEVNVGIPRGPVEFMSPRWRGLFKHMVREARRLGLQITMNAGPGWTGSGGPWVKPEESMQHLVASDTSLTGPRRFEGILRTPLRRPAFFGDGYLPAAQEKAKDEFYRDVAVLAFPAPARPDTIRAVDEKALYVRAPYSSTPGVRTDFPTPAEYPSLSADRVIAAETILDLTDRLSEGGRLSWEVPAGRWTVMRFGRTSTGATTRPAPVPGLGLECDKLDTAALNAHFDAFVGVLLRELGSHVSPDGSGWAYLHIDSWEMGAQNWTAAFRDEFRLRRGYDPLRYLPSITGRVVGSLELSERFLWDLRQTVQELILENHAGHLKVLAARTGFGLSIEPYDMTPCADMSLGGLADVPMCEFWMYGFNTSYSVLEATSLGHTWGRPVVAAEAFTSGEEEAWRAHPGNMKALGDWAFCAGVNRIVFHRFQHQPRPGFYPGMTMGPYGVHWDRTQTWWPMVGAYHRYLSRCQYMLRQGLPVADICYLVAEGAPHVFRPPASALAGDPPDRREFNFDGCSPEALLQRGSVAGGKLVLPDGMEYRVLVLPERETMTAKLLGKVRDLVRDGLTVVGPPPRKSPGLSGYPDSDRRVQEIGAEVWGDCDGRRVLEHHFGKGRVVWEQSVVDPDSAQYGEYSVVARVLRGMGVEPDFESDGPVRYTHRQVEGDQVYFLANRADRRVSAACRFRARGASAEIWDPVTGTVAGIIPGSIEGGRSGLSLTFEPHESFFVVFKRESGARGAAAGRLRPAPSALESLVSLRDGWRVAFDPRWGGPKSVRFDTLQDWSQRPESGIRYYSGIATYSRAFRLTTMPEAGGRLWIDLGSVREMARVRLNGRDLGVLWCPPHCVEVTGAARAGVNNLEVMVANLWPNRLIGDEQLPSDCEYGEGGNLARWPDWYIQHRARPSTGRYTFTTWKHYNKDSPLLPSGLLGPVQILRER